MSDTARFQTAAAARDFMLGGNATVTLVSTKSGARFTYKIRVSDDGKTHFVSLLNGPDNESDYKYLGRIVDGEKLWVGRRVPKAGDIGKDAPSALAFDYAWYHLSQDKIPATLEIWHEGRCARCNRKLTVPSSIESGFGPECAGKGGFSASWAGF
jgi:hypothetical protein